MSADRSASVLARLLNRSRSTDKTTTFCPSASRSSRCSRTLCDPRDVALVFLTLLCQYPDELDYQHGFLPVLGHLAASYVYI